jgi:hypothetical protein
MPGKTMQVVDDRENLLLNRGIVVSVRTGALRISLLFQHPSSVGPTFAGSLARAALILFILFTSESMSSALREI